MIITKPIEAKTVGACANEVLLVAEMEARFPSEWLLIEEPVSSDENGLESGRVVFHSPDRDEMYRTAISSKALDIAFYFTGRVPDGTTIVL